MTKQPTKGRSNEGGLRIGEMETNAILGHGMGSFIKESMMERSDKFEFNIENDNGTIAVDKNGMFKSSYRDTNALSFSKLNTPYSFKLLLQEIEGLGLKTKIITDKEDLNEETENMLNYIEEFDENSYVIDEVENDNL
jgi:DNA-directed RNA polymerase beta subunit